MESIWQIAHFTHVTAIYVPFTFQTVVWVLLRLLRINAENEVQCLDVTTQNMICIHDYDDEKTNNNDKMNDDYDIGYDKDSTSESKKDDDHHDANYNDNDNDSDSNSANDNHGHNDYDT